jgi:hypothetical protein
VPSAHKCDHPSNRIEELLPWKVDLQRTGGFSYTIGRTSVRRSKKEMGRQIIFHMLPEDRQAFLSFVQARDHVIITDFSADSAAVRPADLTNRPVKGKDWLCLWNMALLPDLERTYIPESNIGPYYRIDSNLPILEFSVPTPVRWDKRPALTQGRLYAHAYQDQPTLRSWYEALARWVRKNFSKNPITWMSGYVGPSARQWFERGGLLLPYVPPPVNTEWQVRIYAQHSMH